MRLVARVASTDVERDVADRECLRGTDRVPSDFAAPSVVVFTDALAARGIAAARSEALDEAVSRLGIAASPLPPAEIRIERGGDGAGTVPALETAEWIDRADFFAAVLIGARRSGVGGKAGTGIYVAAFRTDLLGEGDAVLVPGVVATEGFDDADTFAARFIVAVGVLSRDVAASGEDLSAEWVRLGAQLFRTIGTNLIPANLAAERVDVADGVAAISILAPGSVLRLKGPGFEAGTVERSEVDDFGAAAALLTERFTSRGGEGRTEFVPSDLAAVGVVAAHELAAFGVSAEGGVTLKTATAGGGGSTAQPHAVVDRDGSLGLHVRKCEVPTRNQSALVASKSNAVGIPRDRATGRIQFADQFGAEGVVAAHAGMGNEAGAEPGIPRDGSADHSGRDLSTPGVPLAAIELVNALRIVVFDNREGIRDVDEEREIPSRLAVGVIDIAKQNSKRTERGRQWVGVESSGLWDRGEEKMPRQCDNARVIR